MGGSRAVRGGLSGWSAGLRRVVGIAGALAVLAVLAVVQPFVAPASAVDPPTVVVAPAHDLVDGQFVTTTVSGISSSAYIAVIECGPGEGYDACDRSTFVYPAPDATGTATAVLQVAAVLHPNAGGSVDCRAADPAHPCVVRAQVYRSSTTLNLAAPVTFDPAGVLAPPATFTVDPSTGLTDGQTVAVHGTGFAPERSISVRMCRVGSPACDASSSAPIGTTTAAGVLTGTVVVHSVFTVDPYDRVDCRFAGSCELRAFLPRAGSASIADSVGFARGAASPPFPSLKLLPATGFVDRHKVLAAGGGYPANSYLAISECAIQCHAIGSIQAKADGTFVTAVALDATLFAGPGGARTDCRSVAGTCRLAVSAYASNGSVVGLTGLVFDPTAPLAPPLTATATPSTGLVDAQVVTLTGSGFIPSGPNAGVSVAQCATVVATSCEYGGGPDVAVDAAGELHGTYQVSSILASSRAAPVDCRVTACELQVYEYQGSGEVLHLPLSFDPHGPLAPPPTFTVTPATGLTDGQTVHVQAHHVRRSGYASVQECRAGSYTQLTATDCRSSQYAYLQPDQHGDAEVTLVVDAVLTVTVPAPGGTGLDGPPSSAVPPTSATSGGTVPVTVPPAVTESYDCRIEPAGCVVALAVGGSSAAAAQLTTQPISFRPANTGTRYLDRVFSQVDVTRGVVYGDAVFEDGMRRDLHLDLYEPHGDTSPQRPVIIYVHGGFFAFGDQSEGATVGEELARRGYVVISVEYRLFTEGGTNSSSRYQKAIPAAQHDAQAAIRFMRRHAAEHRVAPAAFGAIGYSAGAITALNLAYRAEDPGDSGNPGFPSDVRGSVSLSGTPGNMKPNAPPVLMFHGEMDSTVPYKWAVAGCQRAQTIGDECTLVSYPRTDHDIYSQYADWMPQTIAFFDRLVIPALPAVDPDPTTTTTTRSSSFTTSSSTSAPPPSPASSATTVPEGVEPMMVSTVAAATAVPATPSFTG